MVRTVRRDDEFQDWVRSHRAVLLGAATVMACGDRHRGEDLVQVTLTRLYLAWPRACRMNVEAYARRILVNAMIDETRRASTRHEISAAEVPDASIGDAESDGTDPALLAALATLPAGMRAAVVLRHVIGLSVDDTADALGCSTGNVKSQTARGLDRLRAALTAASVPA